MLKAQRARGIVYLGLCVGAMNESKEGEGTVSPGYNGDWMTCGGDSGSGPRRY
jgi:hypothetical protein